MTQKPDISIDGSGRTTLNDFQPLWLCDPNKNVHCKKEGCQIYCWHTTEIASARTSEVALIGTHAIKGEVMLPPIYPFAELKDQQIRERQHRELLRALGQKGIDQPAKTLPSSKVLSWKIKLAIWLGINILGISLIALIVLVLKHLF